MNRPSRRRAWLASPLAGLHRAVFLPPAWPPPQGARTQWLDVGSALSPVLMSDRPRVIAVLQLRLLHMGGAARPPSGNARPWSPDFGLGGLLDEPCPSP